MIDLEVSSYTIDGKHGIRLMLTDLPTENGWPQLMIPRNGLIPSESLVSLQSLRKRELISAVEWLLDILKEHIDD